MATQDNPSTPRAALSGGAGTGLQPPGHFLPGFHEIFPETLSNTNESQHSPVQQARLHLRFPDPGEAWDLPVDATSLASPHAGQKGLASRARCPARQVVWVSTPQRPNDAGVSASRGVSAGGGGVKLESEARLALGTSPATRAVRVHLSHSGLTSFTVLSPSPRDVAFVFCSCRDQAPQTPRLKRKRVASLIRSLDYPGSRCRQGRLLCSRGGPLSQASLHGLSSCSLYPSKFPFARTPSLLD